VLVVPITAFAVVASRFWRLLVVIAAAVLYAWVFRSYWYAVAGLTALYWFIGRTRPRHPVVALVVAAVLAVCVVGLLYSAVTGSSVSSLRMNMNADRVNSPDATSMIPSYLPNGNTVMQLVNLALAVVVLLVPIPMLALGGAYYSSLFLVITVLWLTFLKANLHLWEASTSRAARETTGPQWHPGLLAFPLAFVTTQAMFEPDYGSALRHLTPVLPCMLLAVGLYLRDRREQAFRSRPGSDVVTWRCLP